MSPPAGRRARLYPRDHDARARSDGPRTRSRGESASTSASAVVPACPGSMAESDGRAPALAGQVRRRVGKHVDTRGRLERWIELRLSRDKPARALASAVIPRVGDRPKDWVWVRTRVPPSEVRRHPDAAAAASGEWTLVSRELTWSRTPRESGPWRRCQAAWSTRRVRKSRGLSSDVPDAPGGSDTRGYPVVRMPRSICAAGT